MNQQLEDQRTFQFLNGLGEEYKSQRSQLLLINTLLIVEISYSVIQIKETRTEVFASNRHMIESVALYNRNKDLN